MKRPPGVPQTPRPASSREPGRGAAHPVARPATATPKSDPATDTAAERAKADRAQADRAQADRAQAVRAQTVRAPSAPARSEPDATTEPITLPREAAGSAGNAPVDTPRAVATDAVPAKTGKGAPTRTPGLLARRASRKSRPAATDRSGAFATSEVPLTARAARRRLRAARRARKQYERSEVRRFTSRSRRRRNLWIAAVGTAVALVAFVLVGVYSPLMALRTIEVTGTARIPADDIVQALDGQLGTPLPLIDFADVKQELSEFSLIRSYVTESRPPDTLVVRIVEREPVATLASAAGFDLVDAAGVVITSAEARAEGYPVIDAAGGASGAGFGAAVAVIQALPEGIRSQLDTVTAATEDDVTLTLAGGARVVWGNSERAEYKAVVLSALLVSHPVGSVTEYDVSSPDSAVVR
ncbi:FtsQ-type POTRA domain-containing protein [Cryobacterium sp.]|uniref:FtsQ-type POTRA domain-containing protein n=1 Tax=Cryobacterium sp. TaxID=1926290 RepID=UPI0026198DD7|nr:FtsQ-type POTRA domain-containing protein [Cryobacterium sp.]MCU1447026.1 putative cell division protein [Cryobacterium sp.]